ncbi:Superoxide dismutase [Cu-Zn] [Cladophialophora carrionii]|uniref:Superoxide dismutase [Cu-Zn] n=1 Tax=Cladophialophora carrionii TaxID=86049 RepID=A0A1C1D247_9EURO|nr:Superoxide dismutase [Cu-Zn] [Cladophialophora carrionii]
MVKAAPITPEHVNHVCQHHEDRSSGQDDSSMSLETVEDTRRISIHITNCPLTLFCLVAVLRGDSKVTGNVTFEQSSESSPTTVTWDISGHDPNAERGMHIHQFGDNTNGCTSAGPHYNPHGKTHGAPSDSERHVGDLGNFKTDAQGNSKGSVSDSFIKLIGEHSVLGRTIVVHAGTDDLGKGGNEESKKTGNAGPRPACGVIGIAA